MKYVEEVNGWEEDALLAGTEFPTELYNVSLSAGASVSRGDLLCSNSMSGVFDVVGGASDATKVLCIAAEDFTADSLNAVTQAYASGVFNREKIKFGGASLTTDPFEQALRTQNLHLRGLKD